MEQAEGARCVGGGDEEQEQQSSGAEERRQANEIAPRIAPRQKFWLDEGGMLERSTWRGRGRGRGHRFAAVWVRVRAAFSDG